MLCDDCVMHSVIYSLMCLNAVILYGRLWHKAITAPSTRVLPETPHVIFAQWAVTTMRPFNWIVGEGLI